MENLRKNLLQALTAMAWADGSLDDAQRQMLKEIYQEESLPEDIQQQWLNQAVEFPRPEELAGQIPESSDRLDLVTQLLQISLSDRRFHPREAEILSALVRSFGVGQDILEELERLVDP